MVPASASQAQISSWLPRSGSKCSTWNNRHIPQRAKRPTLASDIPALSMFHVEHYLVLSKSDGYQKVTVSAAASGLYERIATGTIRPRDGWSNNKRIAHRALPFPELPPL